MTPAQLHEAHAAGLTEREIDDQEAEDEAIEIAQRQQEARAGRVEMNEADKFYMNYSPNCCHKPDCQDVDCPGRTQPPEDKADKEAACLLLAVVGMFIGFIVWSLI